jgi:D-3-phosphoglycerate dehydrogenase
MNVLICDDAHQYLIESLADMGFEVDYQPTIANDATFEIIENYEIIVVSTKTIMNKKMIDKGAKLKYILRIGSGLDTIDVDYAQSLGIRCFASPEGNCNAVAEHTVGMLLALTKKINKSANEVTNYQWKREENRGIELYNKTIAIIGVGHTGATVAKRLSGFDMDILGVDIYKETFENKDIKKSNLEEVFESALIVSLHLPLNNETRYYADKSFFDSFHQPIIIINASRGGIVNTADLLAALQCGQVIAAALDVLENENLSSYTDKEKLIFNQLLAHKNVIITPHIAGWSLESKLNMAKVLISKLKIDING